MLTKSSTKNQVKYLFNKINEIELLKESLKKIRSAACRQSIELKIVFDWKSSLAPPNEIKVIDV